MSESEEELRKNRIRDVGALLMTCALGSGLCRTEAALALLAASTATLASELGDDAAVLLIQAEVEAAAMSVRALQVKH